MRGSWWSALLCVLLLAGCTDGAPSADEVKAYETLTPFFVGETSTTGVYHNTDVDSLVFTYTTSIGVEDDFWSQLAERAERSGWHELEPRGEVRQFERTIPRGDYAFSSAELLRIAYLSGRGMVAVGYVQADSEEEGLPFFETDEAEWAEEVIWPMFERLLAG
jgi:hypothetical protein